MSDALVPYSDLQRMAKQVVESRLFPVKSEAEAITLFLLCQAEGLHPMRALRMFDIIQGRPAIKPKALLASLGERGGHVEWMQNDDQACIGKFYGKACPEGVVVKFDVEDAKKAGLLNKPGPWQQYRADMLRHRCTGRGVDMADPGAAFGLYSTPVVEDFEPPKTEKADFEVVGDEAGPVVSGDSSDNPAPPAIQSATGQTTEEHLAEAKKRREEALERFANLAPEPGEPIEAQLEKIKAEAAKKHGRPKSVPDFCPKCNMAVQQFENKEGVKYWECHERNRERHILKAQEADDQTIRAATEGHYFKWAGGK